MSWNFRIDLQDIEKKILQKLKSSKDLIKFLYLIYSIHNIQTGKLKEIRNSLWSNIKEATEDNYKNV